MATPRFAARTIHQTMMDFNRKMSRMNRSVRVFQVDAFTHQRFTGNPAGVVLDADGLSDAEMQALARELNHGDTAFVLRPDATDHDVRVRFFTPRREAGFVGHATLALHAVLRALDLPPAPRQKQSTGIVQVAVEAGASGAIAITQPPAVLRADIDAALLDEVLQALDLGRADLAADRTPMIAGSGSTRLLLPLRDGAVLAGLRPDLRRLAALSPAIGAAGFFVFTQRPALPDCDTEARMFCPALGIDEDPVSGNAHGMLGAYLLQQQALSIAGDVVRFRGAQGHHMGRPGRIDVELQLRDGALRSVQISGQTIVVFETRIELD